EYQGDLSALDLTFQVQHFVKFGEHLGFIGVVLLEQRCERFLLRHHLPLEIGETRLHLLDLSLDKFALLCGESDGLTIAHDEVRREQVLRNGVVAWAWLWGPVLCAGNTQQQANDKSLFQLHRFSPSSPWECKNA